MKNFLHISQKKLQWKKLAASLAVPLAAGGLAALLTRTGMEIFNAAVNKPAFMPPSWLFPIVWTILYILMGVASYLVLVSQRPNRTALALYSLQLAFNFCWPLLFFNLQLYLTAFIWLLVLWLLALAVFLCFRQISKLAGRLLLPYLLWIAFAGCLNYAVHLLN